MAGADEFVRRIQHLANEVGAGDITAGCVVDQVYAQNQHQNRRFRHTNGRAGFLGDPMMANATKLMFGIARSVITDGGSRLRPEMIKVAETFADYVLKNAPRDPDIGDVLANSGSPWVKDGGSYIYRRPPVQPREAEDHK